MGQIGINVYRILPIPDICINELTSKEFQCCKFVMLLIVLIILLDLYSMFYSVSLFIRRDA